MWTVDARRIESALEIRVLRSGLGASVGLVNSGGTGVANNGADQATSNFAAESETICRSQAITLERAAMVDRSAQPCSTFRRGRSGLPHSTRRPVFQLPGRRVGGHQFSITSDESGESLDPVSGLGGLVNLGSVR